MQHIPPPKQLKKGTETSMKSNIRDVSKYLNEFQEIRIKSKEHAGNIYDKELNQIYEMSNKSFFTAIWNGYKFGFIAGLHYAKNQRRK